ncbi:thiol:disulfide oxidoreductase [Idiomarina tyrosinivorans]|uniref:Thiol:disulfide oxidoreductase n=1 Tax=Idiomarina tyrosinivorans TaxID=1445662 RepID=A0A432ZLH4_9GAMM|nr:glutathione S-transferase N-terminal domain-containing protein [Idiomarina tyrosinivorans]RUO78826.1 thiol:disulfide oxidoreductase [Idiomarina tyrosinivorans]
MYDLYYFPTPNGHKITLMLEECELPYTIHTVDITKGDQFDPEFLKISPNNKMPALVDNETEAAFALFESGAILQYLAEKTGRFLPAKGAARYQVLQWLNWQMGGLGPMLGQNHHFFNYAPEALPYAQQRYLKETKRLYKVLDKQLADKEYIAGEYSIADMAAHPWCRSWDKQHIDINDYPNVKAWLERIEQRPAARKAYAIEERYQRPTEVSDEMRHNMFEREAD